MVRFVMLIRYTEVGIAHIQKTVDRADRFRADAASLGVTVESLFWTLGEFDGVVVLAAPDVETALGLATHVARRGYVRTCLLPAFDQHEFGRILAKMPSVPSGD